MHGLQWCRYKEEERLSMYMYFVRSTPLQHVSKPKQIEQLFYIQLVKIFIFPTISKIESYTSLYVTYFSMHTKYGKSFCCKCQSF